MSIEVIRADYHNSEHAVAIVRLLDAYARDPMGGGEALPTAVKDRVVGALARQPHAFSLIAFAEGVAMGLANCFETLSTFAARPLINIHDFVILAEYRGRGASQLLLEAVETVAKERGCCKITLEVLSGNDAARAAYVKFGFSDYALDASAGTALFWQKPLDNPPPGVT
ncbi:GNAT family N-acetyltransferase [Aromatoleum petrolei]|uniref:GNAT family N-acetyltransferase n=1 Tax=Aromatoleum petrolei TaxID=76116 RepID=A0ABX1MJH5_9RHOO|nr:GNAT family N-acetyltransferase [Aromatoleum petrolei]NMF88102.1 GNAT family N-acetyltransferase [Aromatoleum petrolei]QTQ38888.1 Acetyltransferase (GNAT) domain-containing protein [Aromatoleum petrolei]